MRVRSRATADLCRRHPRRDAVRPLRDLHEVRRGPAATVDAHAADREDRRDAVHVQAAEAGEGATGRPAGDDRLRAHDRGVRELRRAEPMEAVRDAGALVFDFAAGTGLLRAAAAAAGGDHQKERTGSEDLVTHCRQQVGTTGRLTTLRKGNDPQASQAQRCHRPRYPAAWRGSLSRRATSLLPLPAPAGREDHKARCRLERSRPKMSG